MHYELIHYEIVDCMCKSTGGTLPVQRAELSAPAHGFRDSLVPGTVQIAEQGLDQ